MPVIGSLAVSVIAKTQKFASDMTKAGKIMHGFTGTVKLATKAMAGFGAGVALAGAAVGTALVKSQFTAVDALAKTADKLGLTTESLAGMQLAAEEAGISSGLLEKSLQNMVVRIGEAAGGTGEAVDALNQLGLSASMLNRLSPDKQFSLIAEAMRKVRNENDQLRLSFELFGGRGAGLVRMLRQGRDGLAEVQRFARAAGLAVSREMAAAVERANDAWGRFKMIVVGLARQVAVRVAPILERMSKSLTDFFTSDNKIRTFADVIARTVGRVIASVLDGIKELRVGMENALTTFLSLTRSIVNSPLAGTLGIESADADQKLGSMQFKSEMRARVLGFQTPGADFLEQFNKHLGMALDDPAGRGGARGFAAGILDGISKRLEPAAKRAGDAMATLGGAIERADKAAKGKAISRMLGQLTFGLLGDAGAAASPRIGSPASSSLAFAQSGSVESFRQQRRIERQDNVMVELAKKQVRLGEQVRDGVRAIAKGGMPLAPANVGA